MRKRDEFCCFLADRCIYTHEAGEEMALDELSAFAREIQDVTSVRATVVVLISLLLAKIVDLVICRLLLRLAARSNTDLDDRLIQLLHRPLFISVVLVGLQGGGNRERASTAHPRRASQRADQVEEDTLVVVVEIRQVVGEIGEVVADP